MSQENDNLVSSLKENLEKLLTQYGVTYHEFSCVNFADVNCDIRLTLDKRDTSIFMYEGLGRLQRDVASESIEAIAKVLFRSLIRRAYEWYESAVHDNQQRMGDSLTREHLRESAKQAQQYQRPIVQQLSKIWKQVQD